MAQVRAASDVPYHTLAGAQGGMTIADRMAWRRWLQAADAAAGAIYDAAEATDGDA